MYSDQMQWTIDKGGERGSELSVLMVRRDDDDDDNKVWSFGRNEVICMYVKVL